jgi:excisionase family DNA binding protein
VKIDRLLTSKDLAQILAVKVGTVYSWVSRGISPPYIKIGGTIRWREKVVQNWIEAKEKEKKKRNFEL